MMQLGKYLIIALVVLWSPFVNLSASCEFEFSVTEANGAKISEIVTTVARTRALFLWGKESHLRKLGDDVDKDVNFFQFWAFVFSHPKLTNDMKKIQSSTMKYNPFISGGRKAILEAYNSDKECYLKTGIGFATFLKLDPETTVMHLKEGLEALEKNDTGLKPFFDYLILEKNKS
jgi:hypothetical protein